MRGCAGHGARGPALLEASREAGWDGAAEAPGGLREHPGLRRELRGPALPWVRVDVGHGSSIDPGREMGRSLRRAPDDVHRINPRMVWVRRDHKAHPVPTSAMGKDSFHETRLLQAPCSLALDTTGIERLKMR